MSGAQGAFPQRKKTRSKQKNLKKDKRSEEVLKEKFGDVKTKLEAAPSYRNNYLAKSC